MTRPKKQHFVPQCYLQAWCDPNTPEGRTDVWEAVCLEQGVILLLCAKAGARPVVLSEASRRILVHQVEQHWVFRGPDGAPYSRVHVSRMFRKASREAGLRDFRFHDLRHHGATMALNKGFTAPIVPAPRRLEDGADDAAVRRRHRQTLRAAAEAVSGSEGGFGVCR
jgi:integrase